MHDHDVVSLLHLIEQARARHSAEEMRYRRQALIARVTGHDPKPDEDARDLHHLAFMACQKEIDAPAFLVRRVE